MRPTHKTLLAVPALAVVMLVLPGRPARADLFDGIRQFFGNDLPCTFGAVPSSGTRASCPRDDTDTMDDDDDDAARPAPPPAPVGAPPQAVQQAPTPLLPPPSTPQPVQADAAAPTVATPHRAWVPPPPPSAAIHHSTNGSDIPDPPGVQPYDARGGWQ